MDGKLVDSLGYWDYLWRTFGEKFLNDPSFRPDPITEKGVRTVSLYDGMVLVHNNCNIGESGDALFTIANDLLVKFYKEIVPLKEGVAEFLDTLLAKGVKMCVASATASELITILMERFNLKKYFPIVFSCNDIGKGKEFPDVFIKAHEYLGTDKESTWIFEDSIVALQTAAAAGFKTVGIYDKYTFDVEKVKETSTVYIDRGESVARLVDEIEMA